jgi:hypothetical protein
MTSAKRNAGQRDYRNEPTYWFAVLEIAREQGDFDVAAEAMRQLRRLGVCVNYDRPQTRRGASR